MSLSTRQVLPTFLLSDEAQHEVEHEQITPYSRFYTPFTYTRSTHASSSNTPIAHFCTDLSPSSPHTAHSQVQRELEQQGAARKALHDVLQLELSSVRASLPSTAEEWAAMFSVSAQFLTHPILLCDMSLPGAPICSVNSSFEILTGYEASECVGRSCRFLQGKQTDPTSLAAISDAIRAQSPCHVALQNYRKDGTSFLNLLSLKPVFDADGLCCYMIGCPVEVSDHYSGTKTQLRHVDRLLKLTSTRLTVPSTTAARLRMLHIQETVLRHKPAVERHFKDDVSIAGSARSRRSATLGSPYVLGPHCHLHLRCPASDFPPRSIHTRSSLSASARQAPVLGRKVSAGSQRRSVTASQRRSVTGTSTGASHPRASTAGARSDSGVSESSAARPVTALPPTGRSPKGGSPRAEKLAKAAASAARPWRKERRAVLTGIVAPTEAALQVSAEANERVEIKQMLTVVEEDSRVVDQGVPAQPEPPRAVSTQLAPPPTEIIGLPVAFQPEAHNGAAAPPSNEAIFSLLPSFLGSGQTMPVAVEDSPAQPEPPQISPGAPMAHQPETEHGATVPPPDEAFRSLLPSFLFS